MRASAVGGDCLKLARQQILTRELGRPADLDAWRAKAVAQVDAAVATVQSEAPPDPAREDWSALSTRELAENGMNPDEHRTEICPTVWRAFRFLPSQILHSLISPMSVTYLEAIREAQARALARDERVFIYGQDVGAFGGAFKATKGLAKEYPGRVLDSPISEDAQIGVAIGAAIEGMRPIVEMQFADFSSVAFSQIVNQAATHVLAHAGALSHRRAAAERRHGGRRAVPFAEHGSDLRALSGAGRDDPGHRGGRVPPVARRRRDRRPGDLLRAQVPLLPPEGRRPAHDRPAQRCRSARPAWRASDAMPAS